MRTIAVVNQKGGCGKTITSINLSAFLARERRRVLLVDMDPQGHATLGLLTDGVQPFKTMYDVLVCEAGGQRACLPDITRSVFENLDVAPADILLSAAPERLATAPGRENILSQALDEVRDQYDFVVIDCPPNIGLLTFNAMKACSEAIVPMDPSFFSLHGIGKQLETFEVLTRTTGHKIAARVLVTLYSGRTKFAQSVVEELHKHLGGQHFGTIIRYSVKLAEAASHGLPIARYCKRCAGFVDYQALTAEVLQQVENAMSAIENVPPDRAKLLMREPDAFSGPSAPTPTPEGVIFTIEAPDAERVQLVGDFNQWAPDGNEMQPMGRIWTKLLKLPPGRYRYRYLVDGRWLTDPLNAEVEPAPYGGHNSVIVLGAQPAE